MLEHLQSCKPCQYLVKKTQETCVFYIGYLSTLIRDYWLQLGSWLGPSRLCSAGLINRIEHMNTSNMRLMILLKYYMSRGDAEVAV